jgi:UDP-N-acetylglucosamine 2-epimerase (non-hydrolysing)
MSGLEKDSVLNAINIVIDQSKEDDKFPKKIADYDVDIASKQILRVVLSYTDYINRTVWSKS